VEFIDGDDEMIANRVNAIKSEDRDAMVFALAGKDAIRAIEDCLKRLKLEDDANTFLAEVDNKNLSGVDGKDPTIDNYYRIAEMLFVMIDVSRASLIDVETLKAGHEALGLTYISKNRLLFVPKVQRFKHEVLKQIYEIQRFA
jgi:hypothetical protein